MHSSRIFFLALVLVTAVFALTPATASALVTVPPPRSRRKNFFGV